MKTFDPESRLSPGQIIEVIDSRDDDAGKYFLISKNIREGYGVVNLSEGSMTTEGVYFHDIPAHDVIMSFPIDRLNIDGIGQGINPNSVLRLREVIGDLENNHFELWDRKRVSQLMGTNQLVYGKHIEGPQSLGTSLLAHISGHLKGQIDTPQELEFYGLKGILTDFNVKRLLGHTEGRIIDEYKRKTEFAQQLRESGARDLDHQPTYVIDVAEKSGRVNITFWDKTQKWTTAEQVEQGAENLLTELLLPEHVASATEQSTAA